MADPTPEELQTQIDELKSLITAQYEPPTGTEYSYPVVNQPVNDEMWQYITLGLGSGVLDEGGQPYWMRGRENANNTLRITVSFTTNSAQAVLRGFYHKMTEDKTFTVPGVTSTTVYHFCLTYDPSAHSTPGGPVSLQMYAGEPPETMGRHHIVLWTLTRRPNQLLTDAEIERIRPKISPMISVNRYADLPEVSKMLWGTRCLVTQDGVEYRASGSSEEDGGPTWWQRSNRPFDWRPLGLGSSYKSAGTDPEYRIIDGYVEFRGDVKNTGGTAMPVNRQLIFGWIDSRWSMYAWTQATVGNGARPVSVTAQTGSSGSRDTLRVWVRESGTTQFSLDGIRIPFV